jgi:hypothetical protein
VSGSEKVGGKEHRSGSNVGVVLLPENGVDCEVAIPNYQKTTMTVKLCQYLDWLLVDH